MQITQVAGVLITGTPHGTQHCLSVWRTKHESSWWSWKCHWSSALESLFAVSSGPLTLPRQLLLSDVEGMEPFPVASWGDCGDHMTCMKELWKLNSTNRYFFNYFFPSNIWHINVPWSGVSLLSFQFQIENFAFLKDKQINQMIGKLATENLCNFLYVIKFFWKRYVDKNEDHFLKSIAFGSYKLILFAGGRGKKVGLEKAQWRVRMPGSQSWLCSSTPSAGHAPAPVPLPHLWVGSVTPVCHSVPHRLVGTSNGVRFAV